MELHPHMPEAGNAHPATTQKQRQRRWYSPRGARRGVLIAAITVALWLAWAAGYLQGTADTFPPEKHQVVYSTLV